MKWLSYCRTVIKKFNLIFKCLPCCRLNKNYSPSPLPLPQKGKCDSSLRSPFSWRLLLHRRHHCNAQYSHIPWKSRQFIPFSTSCPLPWRRHNSSRTKWLVFDNLLVLTLRFLMMISSRHCIVKLKIRCLFPSISLFWLSKREHSVKMSLQWLYSRIMALITSDNVLLLSPSFNEKMTADLEGGGCDGPL